jgi:hypothetical protein
MLLFSTIIVVIYVTIRNNRNDWTITFKKHTFMIKINQLQFTLLIRLVYDNYPKIAYVFMTHRIATKITPTISNTATLDIKDGICRHNHFELH